MKKSMLGWFASLVITVIVLSPPSYAQAWPNRTIRFLVPYPAGGATDVTARIVAEQVSSILGQPVVVENRAGGTGAIGAGEVARAAPDGYTVMVAADLLVTLKLTRKNIPWDLLTSFEPVSQIAMQPLVIAASTATPATTMAEVIDLARKEPGTIAYASSGIGSTHHLAGELISTRMGIKLVHVPFKGSSEMVKDLLGAQIPVGIIGASVMVPYVNDKRVKLLAVTTKEKVAAFPNTPTLDETVLPGFDVKTWVGAWLPGGTDPAIVKKLNDAIRQGLSNPAARQRIAGMGLEIVASTPDAFRKSIGEESERWAKLIKDANLQIEFQ